jgi:hypothetical protein
VKELWRRSTAILREHPIVWIPVLCADLLGFAAKAGGTAVMRPMLILSLAQLRGSVLTQSPDQFAHVPTAGEMALLFAAVGLVTQFLTICLYAVAAVITWSLIQTFVDDPKPKLGLPIRSAKLKGWRIFGLGSGAFGMVLCFSFIPTALLGLAMPFLPLAGQDRISLMHAMQFCVLLMGYVATAYWVTPRALSLMRPETRRPIAGGTLGDARLLAAIAVASSLAISRLCGMVERSLLNLRYPDHALARAITGAGASLLSALPYVVLFVFLSLAADEGPESLLDDGLRVIDSPADASAP